MIATLVAAVATRWWVVAGLAATYCAQSAIISRDKRRARNRVGLGRHIIQDSDWRHGYAMAAKDVRLSDDEEDLLECRGRDSGADCATGSDVSPKD